MPHDRMQKQRFELRFQINDETALLVRDFARSHLDFDEHSFGKENFSYPVHSVYLDSDELKLYRDIVDHWREAYLSDDNQCRPTLDRKVVSDAHLDYSIPTDVKAPRLMFSGQVILELKFTNRFPDWFRELIRVFGIRQCGAAKYVDGVALQGEYRLSPRSVATY